MPRALLRAGRIPHQAQKPHKAPVEVPHPIAAIRHHVEYDRIDLETV
jgi:hypothetical protein